MKSSLLLALALVSQPLFAGSESHGTGTEGDKDNVWFLGDEPVPYCLVIDGLHEYDRKVLSSLVKESIEKWVVFFKRYGYDRVALGTPHSKHYFLNRQSKKISLNFQEVPQCSDPAHQLQFLFSYAPPKGNLGESPSRSNLGAAVRGDYDHLTYRTGGTVWVKNRAPYTSGFPVLDTPLEIYEHILLHELGHIFGMKHGDVWVMSEDAAEATMLELNISSITGMAFSGDMKKLYLGEIESPGWPFRLTSGTEIPLTNHASGSFAKEWGSLFQDLNIPVEKSALKLIYRSGSSDSQVIDLVISTQDSEIVVPGVFSGKKNPSIDEVSGPTLLTTWIFANNIGPMLGERKRINLLPFGTELPALGSFQFGGKVYPAVIDSEKGPRLKVFLPGSGQWAVSHGSPSRPN